MCIQFLNIWDVSFSLISFICYVRDIFHIFRSVGWLIQCHCNCFYLPYLYPLTWAVGHRDRDWFVRYWSVHLPLGWKKLIFEESSRWDVMMRCNKCLEGMWRLLFKKESSREWALYNQISWTVEMQCRFICRVMLTIGRIWI